MSTRFGFRKIAEFEEHFCADVRASLKTLWLTLPPTVLERELGLERQEMRADYSSVACIRGTNH
jgi:hypothetical protein